MRIIIAVIVCIVLAGVGAVGFIYSGIYNVGATWEDDPMTAWVLRQTFVHSAARRAQRIQVPPNLETPEAVQSGARFFGQNCVVCHAAPGQQRTAISQGMLPQPPDLLGAKRTNNPAEVFWIIKNGVRMTGMPSFGKTQSDEQIWALAAFLHKVRGITPEEYETLAKPSLGAPPNFHH